MEYTVKQVAHMSGVTERTLRYYDEIGLLSPSRIANGYRAYTPQNLAVLQQILFFRELGFDLKHIRSTLANPGFDKTKALEEHKKRLLARKTHLDQLLQTIENTLREMQGEQTMSDEQRFEGFKKKLIEDNEKAYGKEIREKYGEQAVNQSNAKMMGMDEKTYNTFIKLGEEVRAKLKEAAETGDPTSALALEVARLHKDWLLYTWTAYTKEAHAALVQMYVDDERFAKHYEGLAPFLRDAVQHYLKTT